MTQTIVIANPVASQFTGGAHRDVMAALSEQGHVEAMWPASAVDATETAREAVEGGVDLVVAMGGDGMVHHVAQGLVGTNTALGIIPVGTTNVIARLLGVPSRHTKAARLLHRGTITRIGVVGMSLTRGDIETKHHAIFACGIGLDAEVINTADADPYRKYRFGSLHYATSAVGIALGRFASRGPHVTVRFDGRDEGVEVSTALVQFREIYTYFGKVPIRLAASPPAPMTVLALDRMRRTRIPQITVDALTGRDLARVKGVSVFEGVSHFGFEASPPVATQADGERLGMVDSASIEWVPGSLRVVTGA